MNKAGCSWRVLVSAVSALVVSACGGGGEDGGGATQAASTGAEQALAVPAPQADAAWPRYRVQELRALGEGYSAGVALNDRLQVVGSSDTAAEERHATLFGHGPRGALDLDALNLPLGQPNAINNLGQAVGFHTYELDGVTRFEPTLFKPASRTVVALRGSAGAVNGTATSINDKSQIVGYEFNAAGGGFPRAVMYYAGGRPAMVLNAPEGAVGAFAQDINELGQIVGFAGRLGSAPYPLWHATLFGTGSRPARDLGLLPGGYESAAQAINDKGQAVGYTRFIGSVAFYMRATLFDVSTGFNVNLDELSAEDDPLGSTARDVNNRGQVVGDINLKAFTPPYELGNGFLWQRGQMKNLNSLLMPGTGWHITSAYGIDDMGRIAANGVEISTGRRRALLLRPVLPLLTR